MAHRNGEGQGLGGGETGHFLAAVPIAYAIGLPEAGSVTA